MQTRRAHIRSLLITSASFATGLATTARASEGTLTLLVGYPPGGGSDLLARTLAQALGPLLKRTVVVENKPGAGGRIAATQLKSAPADGSVLMVAPNGLTSIQSLVYKDQLKYDIAKDFSPVAKLVATDLAVAVSPDLKVTDAKSLAAWVKANPGKASFASPAAGGLPHFAGLLLGRAIGVDLLHVPYKGGAPTALAVAAGEVPIGLSTIDDFVKLEQLGKLKIIGSLGAARSPLSPNLPTMVEQGFKLQTANWSAMWAPAATPEAKVREISEALNKALQSDVVRQKLTAMVPDYAPPAELARLQRSEWDLWAPIIKASGFKPES